MPQAAEECICICYYLSMNGLQSFNNKTFETGGKWDFEVANLLFATVNFEPCLVIRFLLSQLRVHRIIRSDPQSELLQSDRSDEGHKIC